MSNVNLDKKNLIGVELFISPESLITELIGDELGKMMGREYLSPHNYLSPKCASPTD